MKINISQKLGLSAALVVSIVGCFSESAEARRTRFSGNSNADNKNNSVFADFFLETDKPFSEAIDTFSITEDGESLPFNTSPRGSVTASEFTSDDVEELIGQLQQLSPESDRESIENQLRSELNDFNVVEYEFTLDGLPSYQGTLYIPFETESEQNNLIASLTAFDNPKFFGEGIIPGTIIRNPEDNDIILINDNTQAIDLFGVGGGGEKFRVIPQDIPEPTTAAGLLAALAVGGLSLRKGDKLKGHGKSDRRVKSKAII